MRPYLIKAIALSTVLVVGACGSEAGQTGTGESSPTEAAAIGKAAMEIASSKPAASDAFPRDRLPSYVETAPGGSYITSFFGSNELRSTGSLMYGARGSAADVASFHRTSMERQGMTVGPATTKEVRDNLETSFTGTSPDGKSKLEIVVIDKAGSEPTVMMRFADEKG